MGHFPDWYLLTVGVAVSVTGLLSILLLCLIVSAAIIDKATRLLKLHNCFIAFMVQWVREKEPKS